MVPPRARNDGIVYRSNPLRAAGFDARHRLIIEPTDYALSYEWQGHTFYTITQGTRTLIYNCATSRQHEQSSSQRRSALRARSRDQLRAPVFVGRPLLPARFTFPAMSRSMTISRLFGRPFCRRSSPRRQRDRAFCSRVEIEMEFSVINTPGPVTLEWSDDGGRTWTGGPRTMSAGTAEELRKRVFTTRLGSFRQRTFRITTHGHTSIYAVDADIAPGAT